MFVLTFQEENSRASSGLWKNRSLPTSSACGCLLGMPGAEEMKTGCFGLCCASPSCLHKEGMEGVARWGAVLLYQEQLFSEAASMSLLISNKRECPFPYGCSTALPFPLFLSCKVRCFIAFSHSCWPKEVDREEGTCRWSVGEKKLWKVSGNRLSFH